MAKVLITRFSALGDVALLVPVVASLSARYPNDSFYVLTREPFAPLFNNIRDNVYTIPVDLKLDYKGFWGIFKLIKLLFPMKFTHLVDQHDVLRTKIIRKLLRLKGIPYAHIDKGRSDKKQMIESKKLFPPLKTSIQRYIDTFQSIGLSANANIDNVYGLPYHLSEPISMIGADKSGSWIGIAPFSKHQGKIYPVEKMEKIVEHYSRYNNVSIFLFGGGREEKEILATWSKRYSHIITIAGMFDLEKEVQFISYLDVMVSMDSANMHLASLVNVPVVSIWGATHPSLGFYGWKQDSSNAIQVDLKCRPCSVFGNKPCTNSIKYECMQRIQESQVIEKIDQILANNKI